MPSLKKTFCILMVIACGLALGGPLLFAQTDSPETLTPPQSPWPKMAPESGNGAISSQPVESDFIERRRKKMVEVPPREGKRYFDAADFKNPFYFLNRASNDPEEPLEPGVTLDGVQFHSYADADAFIEKFYKLSPFTLEDVFGKISYLERKDSCLKCHQGIEEISGNHDFRCTQCHEGNPRKRTLPAAHEDLVSNPSDMEHAPEYCGKCHADQIKKMAFSSMASARGIINATRYALGAQAPNEPPYSLNPGEGEQPLPPAGKDHFADRYLKTQCLRCHLQSEAPHRPGDYRASGCAACHMVYGNDGMSLTHDRAIQKKQKKEVHARVNRFERKFAANSLKNPRGYPLLHKFTLAVPSVQCEHCHNHNGVGNEFEGLMGKPERPETTPDAVRKTRPVLYGREHTFLLPDIHREKGMHCIDCHGGRDLKGHEGPDGKWVSGSEIQCSDCHGTHSKYPDEFLLIKSDPRSGDILKSIGRNPNLSRKIRFGDTILLTSRGVPLPNIKREKDEWTLYSKVTGSKHSVPILKNIEKPPAHRVVKHMEKMECATCHARWSAGEWGLHLLNPNRFDPQKWKQWTLADPTLQYLVSNFDTKFSQVKMLDWLTAKSRPKGIEGNWIDGAWIGLFSETGWSNLILGKNPQGKYSIMKPRYQYLLLKENANGFDPPQVPVTADGKPGLTLLPYTPHTIRKAVRSCESCHENPVAMGLGDPALKRVSNAAEWNEVLKTGNHPFQSLQPKQVVTGAGEAIQTAYPPPARFLTREEMDSLRKRDKTYRALRYLDLKELSFPRLLLRGEYPYDIRHQAKEQQIKSQLAPAEAGGGSGQDAADVPPHTSGSTTPVAPDSSLTRPVP